MDATTHLEWILFVFCLVLCVLCGVAFSLDDDDDPGAFLRPTDGPWCSRDETFCALPIVDGQRLVAGPDSRTSTATTGLLAAVPGGLCLLI